jgi:hypothetical protein
MASKPIQHLKDLLGMLTSGLGPNGDGFLPAQLNYEPEFRDAAGVQAALVENGGPSVDI